MVDRAYALDDVVEATRYVDTGQKSGNVVLRIAETPTGADVSARPAEGSVAP